MEKFFFFYLRILLLDESFLVRLGGESGDLIMFYFFSSFINIVLSCVASLDLIRLFNVIYLLILFDISLTC